MKEHGILMSGHMVRAYMAGLKTQTRRLVKPQPYTDPEWGTVWEPNGKRKSNDSRRCYPSYCERNGNWNPISKAMLDFGCPYGQPGDRLWFRETWAITVNVNRQIDWPDRPHNPSYEAHENGALCEAIIYRADGDWQWLDGDGSDTERSHWRPSIHMPRWAARHTPLVTGIRVERLGDISPADCAKEGLQLWPEDDRPMIDPGVEACNRMIKDKFVKLWNSIHGPGSWERDKGKWVWVVEFEKYGGAA